MNFKRAFLVLFLISSLGGYAQNSLEKLLARHNSHSIPYISVQELKMLHKGNNVAILDAREREEFEVSHIKGAVFVSYSNFSAEEVSHMFKDKNTPIVVYCSLGIRSENISEKLKKSGFTNVRNLYGGIFEWKNNGYSVVEMQGRETEKVHAFSPSWGKWLKKGEKVY
ncbi:hypothetical protein BH23BAC2_BH23BAC2_02980 [soil metagenome]